MMTPKLRVATDISILSEQFDAENPRHGVYNVVEELLQEISKRDDIDLTAVALSGDYPLVDSMRAFLYMESRSPRLGCSFQHSFRSNNALMRFYSALFPTMLPGGLERLPGTKRMSFRLFRHLFYRMTHQYRLLSPPRFFDDSQFDVFHCPHLAVPEKERTGNVPRVITIYDLIPVTKPEFVTQPQVTSFKASLARIEVDTDWVTCISEFTKNEFCDYTGMPQDRCVVTPLAASSVFHRVTDAERIKNIRTEYGIPEGEYFLTLAAPQPRKNLVQLINSFFRLLEERRLSDTYLVLAGSKKQGWMYDEIFATAESSSKYRSRLIFSGYVEEEDLPTLYSGAVAFVFPSLYEGFGLPALEAMACGTPVITSNTTSLPEVVGDAAVLVDPLDVDELCEAMSKVLDDESLRTELRLKGLMRAAEFSWKRFGDLTAKAYHLAAEGAGK